MPETLSESQFELIILWVDGELASEPARLAEAEQLARSSPAAQAIADDWRAAKVALREAVASRETSTDFSMLRGRVMTALPSGPRAITGPAAIETAPPRGFWAWLEQFGFGKVSFAVGVAAAVAAWLLLVPGGGLREPEEPVLTEGGMAEMSTQPNLGSEAEQAVIIENLDLDSGSVTVNPGERSGDATVIWHFESAAEGEG